MNAGAIAAAEAREHQATQRIRDLKSHLAEGLDLEAALTRTGWTPRAAYMALRRRDEEPDLRKACGRLASERQRLGGLQPCGTIAAYRRHFKHGEEPCDACVEARRVSDEKAKETRRRRREEREAEAEKVRAVVARVQESRVERIVSMRVAQLRAIRSQEAAIRIQELEALRSRIRGVA